MQHKKVKNESSVFYVSIYSISTPWILEGRIFLMWGISFQCFFIQIHSFLPSFTISVLCTWFHTTFFQPWQYILEKCLYECQDLYLFGITTKYSQKCFVAQLVKNLPAVWETWVRSLGWEDPLEKGMATHSSILAWRILWPKERGGLQFMG